MKPLIGITCDLCDSPNGKRLFSYPTYGRAIEAAGGLPMWIAPSQHNIPAILDRLDGLLLTGGDDPRTEPFGVPSHPAIVPVEPDRQAFESALLSACDLRPELPILGICLGMQMMALHAGGTLDQHLPDTRNDWHRHWNAEHAVVPEPGSIIELVGMVLSKHRQAVSDPGSLAVIARSDDGLIEAIAATGKHFAIGVQWHPERTSEPVVGSALFTAFVTASRLTRSSP